MTLSHKPSNAADRSQAVEIDPSLPLPDVLTLRTGSRLRFEGGTTQWLAAIEPAVVRRGEQAQIRILLQNTSTARSDVWVRLAVERLPKRRGQPLRGLRTIRLSQGPLEAGELTTQVQVPAAAKAGAYILDLRVIGTAKGHGKRIRPPEPSAAVPPTPTVSPLMLLAGVLYAGVSVFNFSLPLWLPPGGASPPRGLLELRVEGEPAAAAEEPREPAEPMYEDLWTLRDYEFLKRYQRRWRKLPEIPLDLLRAERSAAADATRSRLEAELPVQREKK